MLQFRDPEKLSDKEGWGWWVREGRKDLPGKGI